MKQKRAIVAALAIIAMQTALCQPVTTKQARESGISTCLKKIDQIANFLVKQNDHHSNATWNTNQPDQRLFNSQIIIKFSDGAGLAVMNAAPTRAGKCDVTYSRVFTYPNSCISVRETNYKNWNFKSEHSGAISLTNANGSVDGILLQAGSGCAIVLTETIFD
jgi:hypothetical protein